MRPGQYLEGERWNALLADAVNHVDDEERGPVVQFTIKLTNKHQPHLRNDAAQINRLENYQAFHFPVCDSYHLAFSVVTSGLYNKHMTIVNDNSSIVSEQSF